MPTELEICCGFVTIKLLIGRFSFDSEDFLLSIKPHFVNLTYPKHGLMEAKYLIHNLRW